jgi:hypothetical protein
MTVKGLSGADFNFALLMPGHSKQSPIGNVDRAGAVDAGDRFSSMLLRVAEFQSQMLGALTGSVGAAGETTGSQGIEELLASLSAAQGSPAARASSSDEGRIDGLSVDGRKMSLFDPESAFRMMTRINKDEVVYKAQFAELSMMKSSVAEIGKEAQALGEVGSAGDTERLRAGLLAFAGEYNEWVSRFDADLQGGGLLAGTQAAQVSRYELEQSVGNIFNGATEGLHGLRDLGFAIDPLSRLAVVDTARLDATLAGNPQGAIVAVREFSANFAKSAELLNSEGNFIPNRLANLDRVIDYIADNRTSLQAEFGLGEAAKPSPLLAQALSTYQRIAAM